VHGLGDDALTWKKILFAPSTEWGRPINFYAVDLPGRGKSSDVENDLDLRARNLGEELGARFKKNAPECGSSIGVGNSWGGNIVSFAAIREPNLLKRLILLSPGGMLRQKSGAAESDILQKLESGTVEGLKEFQRRAYFRPREIPEYIWSAIGREAEKSNVKRTLAVQTPEDVLGNRISELQAPVLMLWGLSDHIIEITEGRELAKKFRSLVFREIEKCGHMPQKECPEQVVQGRH
jgi:pimeloyl-ACP methyl ester carboxylesterase